MVNEETKILLKNLQESLKFGDVCFNIQVQRRSTDELCNKNRRAVTGHAEKIDPGSLIHLIATGLSEFLSTKLMEKN